MINPVLFTSLYSETWSQGLYGKKWSRRKKRGVVFLLYLTKQWAQFRNDTCRIFQVYKEASYLKLFNRKMCFYFMISPVSVSVRTCMFLSTSQFPLSDHQALLPPGLQVLIVSSPFPRDLTENRTESVLDVESGELTWNPDSVHLVGDKLGEAGTSQVQSPTLSSNPAPFLRLLGDSQVNTKEKAW